MKSSLDDLFMLFKVVVVTNKFYNFHPTLLQYVHTGSLRFALFSYLVNGTKDLGTEANNH